VYAAEEAIKKKMKIISLVGKSGGELKKNSNICIHIKSQNTAYIQEAHMSILHCICEILDNMET
jgi:D-sedoheptulose 7-phosphate isomerase|tara:strand:+ start:473 stop:664 length:192 start_codon:yes stop_codon:yes gene_type:complete